MSMDMQFYSGPSRDSYGQGTRTQASPQMCYFFFSVFALFGLVFVWIGITSWIQAEASKSWTPVDGKILSFEIKTSHSTSSHGGSSTSYSASVVYEYTFDDVRHQGRRIAFITSGGGYSSAEARVRQYASGTEVKVYVDPAAPQEAVLEPGVNAGNYIFILMGGIFAAIGIAGLANTPKLVAKTKNQEQVLASLGEANVTAAQSPDALGKLD
jgi:hypothetical protein